MRNILVFLILAALAWYGYGKYQAPHAIAPEQGIPYNGYPPLKMADSSSSADPSFKCDGRTMCSQMTSCEEATYFIQHCSNTKMDGNNDGVPCERQWCN